MLQYRAKFVGVALLSLAFGSEALTLGRVRGAALIGQPLDMVVQVQMDAGEDAVSLCFDAEVFHADTRQDASRVRVVVETTSQPHVAHVRILSSAIVDEPVVTVYLRTGCGQKTSRRYVLLADLPSEVAAPMAPLVVPASVTAKVDLTPVAPASAVKAKTARAAQQAVRRAVEDKRPEAKAAAAPSKSAMSDRKSNAGRSAGQSRLRLDPLELFSDRVADLDSYMTFAPPDDALRSMQKMQALEVDVTALRALAARNETSLVDLKSRLQKAEAERLPGGLIYGLIALLLACLAAVAFFWNRQRRVRTASDDWWSASIASPVPPAPEPGPPSTPVTARKELDNVLAPNKAHTAASSGLLHVAAPSSALDVNLMEMSQSHFDDLMQTGTTHSSDRQQARPPSPTATPQAGRGRTLNPEAILDIRHQAGFFVSLGKTELAVRILKQQINESDAPNPFVYLDLLSLLHSLSLRSDYQQLREDFNRLFNGSVPEFSFFADEGSDLQSYPDVLSRITALWPAPEVLEVIEACIFRDPRNAKDRSFDLAAFRDLLLLHSVAHGAVIAPPAAGREPGVGTSPSSAAPGGTSTGFSNSGYATPAPFKVPGRSTSMQPDLSLAEIPRPPLLDLDLSVLELEGLAFNPVPTADIDFDLLIPSDWEVDGRGVGATRPPDSGNLMNFVLPDAPKKPGPTGNNSV